jgi:hypothetical protein
MRCVYRMPSPCRDGEGAGAGAGAGAGVGAGMHLQRVTESDRVADRSAGVSAERVVGTRESSLAVDLKTSVHRAPNTRQACSTVGVQKIIRWRPWAGR